MKGGNGFFLMVEGGRINHAHNANQARKALDETIAFDSALHDVVRTLREQGELEVRPIEGSTLVFSEYLLLFDGDPSK